MPFPIPYTMAVLRQTHHHMAVYRISFHAVTRQSTDSVLVAHGELCYTRAMAFVPRKYIILIRSADFLVGYKLLWFKAGFLNG